MRKVAVLALAVGLFFLSNCGGNEPGPKKDIGLYINELQAAGGDWLELYNSTSQAIDLAGFKLYDDVAAKYTIASGMVPAKGFWTITCDGTGLNGNASFKLTSAGETVILEDNKGNILDEVEFPPLINNASYGRFPDGSDTWKITGLPTRGSTNGNDQAPTVSGVKHTPNVPSTGVVSTTAVVVSAKVSDLEGVSSVKLYWRKDLGSFTSVPMTLSLDVYTATIPAQNAPATIQYYVEATNTRNASSKDPDNAPSNVHSYLLNIDPLPVLYINEFMAFNSTCCPDKDGGVDEFNDWIEIYNPGPNAVNISGFYLSDDASDPLKFKIANTDATKTTIPANGYLLIWADEQGSQGILHANFQLLATGEEVGLYYIDGREIDFKSFGAQSENKSYGRMTDGGGTWQVWNTPTPKAKNQ